MPRYEVRYKASVYYDITVEAVDDLEARELAGQEFDKLLEKSMLPMPLEWESVEAWDIDEVDKD